MTRWHRYPEIAVLKRHASFFRRHRKKLVCTDGSIPEQDRLTSLYRLRERLEAEPSELSETLNPLHDIVFSREQNDE